MANQNQNNVICTILAGPPGCGKTTTMLDEIAQQPGRYFLVAPRVELIEEHHAWLRGLVGVRSSVQCLAIHSRQSITGEIDRRVDDALYDHRADDHVVILATHRALFELDPSKLTGWHVRIDELPANIVSGCVHVGASWRALEARYDLGQPSGGWREVSRRRGVERLTFAQREQDVAEDLAEFHGLADSRRPVFVNVAAWADAGLPRRSLQFRSIWTPAALQGCASVKIAAAGFKGSLFEKAVLHLGGVQFAMQPVGTPRSQNGGPRITVHYYTKHAGSTTWWETPEGRRCIVAISKYLEGIRFGGYWSCNRGISLAFWDRFGEHCSPKQEGSNALRHHTSCAMIYSCKAQASDKPIIELLGLDEDAIRRAREYEDLWQLCLRGAIRDASYAGDYDIHVYSLDQAEELARRLDAAGYGSVDVVPRADVGLMEVVRPTTQRDRNLDYEIPVSSTAIKEQRRAQDSERKRLQRSAARVESIANGTYRPRGRPPGSSNIVR